MKFNPFRFVFILSSILLLSSCLGTNTSTTNSSDASIVSLTFAANDSVPYLNTAKFTLDADGKTIVNVDSLPFKTRIDSVLPTFSFMSSAAAFLHLATNQGFKFTKGKKDSVLITGKDTVDFRQPQLKVSNFAADGKTYKAYDIKVNVHQVDPEFYVWSKVTPVNLVSNNASNQKAVILNDKFLYYQNNGATTYLNTSNDGYNWNSASIIGLPTDAMTNNILQFNSNLFLLQNGKIYSSIDGQIWTSNICTPVNYTYKALIGFLNDSLRSVVQNNTDQKYYFASSKDGIEWKINLQKTVDDNFPISDFASITFASPSGKSKLLIIGGYSSNGNALNTRWTSEDGLYWIDFSQANTTLPIAHLGSSIISYDQKLFLFGKGTNSDVSLRSYFKQSIDEGLTWQTADTLHNFLPPEFVSRSYQSVVVYKPIPYSITDSKDVIVKSNRIFIIGGKSGSTIFSDVWTGKLNRKNFLLQ